MMLSLFVCLFSECKPLAEQTKPDYVQLTNKTLLLTHFQFSFVVLSVLLVLFQ